MSGIHIVCSHCGGINRLPAERLGENPSCGKCHKSILDGIPTSLNSQNFEKFISRNDLPVLVDFWADWCGPCKMMAPVFSQTASQMASQLRFAKVDTEKAQDISARYNIRSIPTMILFKNSREVDRVAGAMDQAGLTRWIKSNL